jgi:hypothetical protein
VVTFIRALRGAPGESINIHYTTTGSLLLRDNRGPVGAESLHHPPPPDEPGGFLVATALSLRLASRVVVDTEYTRKTLLDDLPGRIEIRMIAHTFGPWTCSPCPQTWRASALSMSKRRCAASQVWHQPTCGTPYVVAEGESGILAERTVEDVAATLGMLRVDLALVKQMGEQARRRALRISITRR